MQGGCVGNNINKLKLVITFIALSILTCGLPIYVMQATAYFHISTIEAGSLESYQNITGILASFVIFGFLLRYGYRRSIIACMGVLVVFAFLMPIWNGIWAIRLYLILIGIAMVVMKVTVYSSVSLLIKDAKKHASFLNFAEAIYTLGSVAGMWMFSVFIRKMPAHWMNAFWLIGVICLVVLLLWLLTDFPKISVNNAEHVSVKQQAKMFVPIICSSASVLFLLLLFCSETLEQGVGSWLPYFFHGQFLMTQAFAAKLASLLMFGELIGRVFGGIVLRFIRWDYFFMVMFFIGFVFIGTAVKTMPSELNAITTWSAVPWNGYALVAIGFFLGPIYPTIISALLITQRKSYHAITMSLVMIFTALFDSVSSKLLGVLMYLTSDRIAFALVVIPCFVLFFSFIRLYYKSAHKNKYVYIEKGM